MSTLGVNTVQVYPLFLLAPLSLSASRSEPSLRPSLFVHSAFFSEPGGSQGSLQLPVMWPEASRKYTNVNVNVSYILAISMYDCDTSG